MHCGADNRLIMLHALQLHWVVYDVAKAKSQLEKRKIIKIVKAYTLPQNRQQVHEMK